eukprot:COSAG02_NODE_6719_length_3402_cov_9.452619_1_plen_74_part_00
MSDTGHKGLMPGVRDRPPGDGQPLAAPPIGGGHSVTPGIRPYARCHVRNGFLYNQKRLQTKLSPSLNSRTSDY